jgi:hypothetical protein
MVRLSFETGAEVGIGHAETPTDPHHHTETPKDHQTQTDSTVEQQSTRGRLIGQTGLILLAA